MEEDTATQQHEVQRKMGRCLLRLQQYELLLKSIAAHLELEGPADKLEAIRDAKVEALSTKTLGHLVGLLTGSYLAIDAPDNQGALADDGEPRGEVPPTGWVRMRSSIAMSAEGYAQTIQQLRELVDLRNERVHHLVEKFNVWSPEGCAAAVVYLDASYQRIDEHFASLMAWAQSMREAHALTASFIASKEWEDFFIHRVAPEGTVDWPQAIVVKALQEAAAVHAKDGWTNLADAIEHISAHHRDQTPKRYGCSSWRQVLHESSLFDIRRDKAMDASPGATWYRSREQTTNP